MKDTKPAGLSHMTMGSTKRTLSRLSIALALAAGTVLTAPVAEAGITSIVIDCARSQSPTFCAGQSATFGGTSFGAVGQYEKLRGTASGELDPADPRNALITDIELAHQVGGKVHYSMEIFILKPINLSNGNNSCSSISTTAAKCGWAGQRRRFKQQSDYGR